VGAAIGGILGSAVGVAISPVPIIALILMLFSPAAARNGVAFLAGWLAGLLGIGLVVLAIGTDSADGRESDGSGILKIVIGVLFLSLAERQWSRRPRDGEEAAMPGWMGAVDHITAPRALGLGLLLTVANPKNLGLTVAAAASISGAGLGFGEEVGVLAVFVAIASLTIIVPVAAYLAVPDRAGPELTSLKGWLTRNNAAVMTVLFLVLGAKLLGDGIAIVT
jgi:hypothetical protein